MGHWTDGNVTEKLELGKPMIFPNRGISSLVYYSLIFRNLYHESFFRFTIGGCTMFGGTHNICKLIIFNKYIN